MPTALKRRLANLRLSASEGSLSAILVSSTLSLGVVRAAAAEPSLGEGESAATFAWALSVVLLSLILILSGIVLSVRLAWREARGAATPSAVAAGLWVVAVPSLLLSSGFPGLLVLPGAAICLSFFYTGRKGRRLHELPSIRAFAAVWRQFWSRYRTRNAHFAWKVTQAQIPLFLLALACVVIHSAVTVFTAALAVAAHGGAALVMTFGVALIFLAASLVAAALAAYPWSQYQYGVVLQRFEGAGEMPPARRCAAMTGMLLLLDLILVATVLAPFAISLLAGQRDWPTWPLVVLWLSWPALLLVVILIRMHFREILTIRGRGLGDGLSTMSKVIASDLFETLRGALLQSLCYVPVILLALLVAPIVLILVAVPAAAMAALHAAVWWLAGYHGNGHLWALLIEVPLVALLYLMATGYLTSPLALFQMLYRAEYVKKLIGDVHSGTNNAGPDTRRSLQAASVTTVAP